MFSSSSSSSLFFWHVCLLKRQTSIYRCFFRLSFSTLYCTPLYSSQICREQPNKVIPLPCTSILVIRGGKFKFNKTRWLSSVRFGFERLDQQKRIDITNTFASVFFFSLFSPPFPFAFFSLFFVESFLCIREILLPSVRRN